MTRFVDMGDGRYINVAAIRWLSPGVTSGTKGYIDIRWDNEPDFPATRFHYKDVIERDLVLEQIVGRA